MINLNHWCQRLIGKLFSVVYMNGGRFACFNQSEEERRRPTSAKRRTGFDWRLFQVMLEDRERLAAYRHDIFRSVANARVLEIGPGPRAILTRMCLDAGAASLTTVEGDPWVAAEATNALQHYAGSEQRWTLVQKLSTELEAREVMHDLRFDVLVCEIYDSIACREQVIETISDLRARGFTFGSVISRGFETWVAPCRAPSAQKMSRIERLALGWGWSNSETAQHMIDSQRSTVHGDHALISQLCLAPPQRWQHADFESDVCGETATKLRFTLKEPDRYRGFLFWNKFLFHEDRHLDTLSSPSNWGVTFVPLHIARRDERFNGECELRTSVPDPRCPSECSFEVTMASEESGS